MAAILLLCGGAFGQAQGQASFQDPGSDQAASSASGAATSSQEKRGDPAKQAADPGANRSAPAGEGKKAAPAGEPARPAVDPGGETVTGPPGREAGLDAETYRVRLRDLERRIEALKEQIRRSHSRLALLSDRLMSGVDSGGRVDIQFENDLSDAWRVIELVIVLDGVVQYKKSDASGALSAQKVIPIFSGSLGKGDHVVQVMMKLRGHGFGIFSYLRGLDATVRNDYSFSLSRGKSTEIKVTAWEQGGPTTSAEERPNVRFSEMSTGGGSAKRGAARKPAVETQDAAPGPTEATGKD